MINLLTKKISKQWSKLRALDYTDHVNLDNERLILTKFNQVKPLILRAVEDCSPVSIRSWITDIAIYYGKNDDIKNRNIWVDLHECFKLLQEHELLQIHNGELK
jgi:hypothetical protein